MKLDTFDRAVADASYGREMGETDPDLGSAAISVYRSTAHRFGPRSIAIRRSNRA